MSVSKTLKLDKSGGIDIKPDSYVALLLGVVHIGTQKNIYKGVTSFIDQVLFQFELQDVLLDSGNPVVISKVERNSMKSKANLVKLGKAMGANVEEGIDFETLVGRPLMVNMDFNEAKTRVVIKSYTTLPSALKHAVKPLMGTPRMFLDVDEISDTQKAELPEWVQKLINERIKGENISKDSSSSTDL